MYVSDTSTMTAPFQRQLRVRSIDPIPEQEYVEWWFKTVCLAFWSNKDNKDMFEIAFKKKFHNFNVNLRKNDGFLTSIPRIPIPEYGQSNAPWRSRWLNYITEWRTVVQPQLRTQTTYHPEQLQLLFRVGLGWRTFGLRAQHPTQQAQTTLLQWSWVIKSVRALPVHLHILLFVPKQCSCNHLNRQVHLRKIN